MSHDTLIHRAVRPLVRRIAPSRVTPNQLTTARLMSGAAAGLCCALGGGGWTAAGGVLLLVSLLLDRADGELARLTGKTSAGGYRYDLICDCAATILIFLGMGFGARGALGPLGALAGVVAGLSVAVVFFEVNVVRLAPPPRSLTRRGRAVFDPDDAMLAVPMLIWLGLTPLTVEVAATATPLVAALLALLGWREALRRRKAERAGALTPGPAEP